MLQERICPQEETKIPGSKPVYRGRIAPTPSGWLHLGHATTFTIAWRRAREANGGLVYRNEDLDTARCKLAYSNGAVEDLHWWGLDWDGIAFNQSQRLTLYNRALVELARAGMLYLSQHTRSQVKSEVRKVSPVDGDPLFPAALRNEALSAEDMGSLLRNYGNTRRKAADKPNIRVRVPDGRAITFLDNRTGEHTFVAGRDFGDFIIWRRDGMPAYELAVVVDDVDMEITEVVRGEDLLLSTARQLLLYEALGWTAPEWYHCELVNDPQTGTRMSKTHRSLALRELRLQGLPPGKSPNYYFDRLRLTG